MTYLVGSRGLFKLQSVYDLFYCVLAGAVFHDIVADLGIFALRFQRAETVDLFVGGDFLFQNIGHDIVLVTLDKDGYHVGEMRLHGHCAADVHYGDDVLAAGEDLLYVALARAVKMVGVVGGLKQLTLLMHLQNSCSEMCLYRSMVNIFICSTVV